MEWKGVVLGMSGDSRGRGRGNMKVVVWEGQWWSEVVQKASSSGADCNGGSHDEKSRRLVSGGRGQ